MTQEDVRKDMGFFFGPEWHGTHVYKPEGKWNSAADVMQINFVESGHAVFQASSALDRGYLERWNSGDTANAELKFRTVSTEQSRIDVLQTSSN